MIGRFLVALTLSTVSLVANAASPTDIYLATKEKAVLALKHPAGAAEPIGADKIEAEALVALAQQMRNVVGPLGLRGFPENGKSNTTSLSDGSIETGYLDGIQATSSDGATVLITNTQLIQAWLKFNEPPSSGQNERPLADMGKIISTGFLYTQAFQSGAAVQIYTELPVVPPGSATTRAFLAKKGQESVAPHPPDMLVATVIRGERVYIFERPLKPEAPEITDCKVAWTNQDYKVRAIYEASSKPGGPPPDMDKALTLADAAESDFFKCYSERAATQPFFANAVKQAQELIAHVE